MASQITFLLFLLLLLFTAHCSSRRILHQPFFPVTDSPPPPPSPPPPLPPPFTTQSPSPSPQPQPQPQPQPKHPFSSLTQPTTDNHRFFPSYTTPPPPPTTTTTSSLPTFPANISSISLPSSSSSSSKSHVSTKLLLLSLTFSLLAIAFISAIIASLLYHRNHTHKPPPPDSLRLFPANHHTSDKPSPPPTLPPNFSTPSSEFLYLGTLVSPLHDQKPLKTSASSSSAATTIDYNRMGSPELHPLPPLPRQDFRHQHNLNDGFFSDCEVLSPPPQPTPPPPPPRGFAGKPRKEEILKPKLKALHWDKVRASSEKATAWDHLKISSFQ